MGKRIDQARLRLEVAKARVQRLEAIQRKKERKKSIRRRIIIGEAIEKGIVSGRFTEDQLSEFLNEYVTKLRDREFLGLSVDNTAD